MSDSEAQNTESLLRESLVNALGGANARALRVEGDTAHFVIETALTGRDAEALRARGAEAALAVPGIEAAEVALAAADPQAAPELPGPEHIPGVKHVIAVGSGKGGVGKSTVSVNLALALADRGLQVGMLDADIYGPSLPTMLGATGQPVGRDNHIVPLAAHGLRAMSVGMLMEPGKALVWRGPMLVTAVRQLLHDVIWAPLDVLIVDLPPGTGDVQITLSQSIPLTGAVIVTTPQDVALIDARRAIDLFEQTGTPIAGIVENMAFHFCPHCGEEDDIFGHGGGEAEARERGVPFLGKLPLERRIRQGSDDGKPVFVAEPDGRVAAAFREIASALAEELALTATAPRAVRD